MERYVFNAHAAPILLTGVMMFASGVFVLLKRPAASVNRNFFLICLSVTIWLIPTGLGYLSIEPDLAQLWFKCDNFGVMFISVTVFHFVTSFLQLERRRAVRTGYLVAFLFGLVVVLTDWLVIDVRKFSWGYFPRWGYFSIVFFAIFFGYMAASFNSLWLEYRKVREPARKNQIKYLFLAFALAYTGSVDYLPTFGIPVYPFGFISIFLFLSVVALTIIRYRLMDITLAMTRGTIFMVVYALVLGAPLLVALPSQPQIERLLGTRWWVWLWIACAILATVAHYSNLYFQRLAENRLLAEQRRYQATLRRASEGMTRIRQLPRLLKLTVSILSKTVGLTYAAIYLIDMGTKRYALQASRGKDGQPAGPAIEADDPLIQYLNVHKNAVVLEELHLQHAADPGLREVELSLRHLGAALVIPSFIHDHLLGFVVMGAKRSGGIYTDDDLKVLMTLANQAALAIENARFYEAERERQAEMFHTAQLASLGKMAGGMSHQINNRFYAECIMAGTLKGIWKEMDLAGVPEPVKQLILKTMGDLQKIENDAVRGGDIAKTLLNFSKPGKAARITFQDILKLSMEAAQFRVKFGEIDYEPVVVDPLPSLDGNLNQLAEVFFNLMSNAYDAIKKKQEAIKEGSLKLLAGQTYKGKLAISVSSITRNGVTWLQAVVHDTGIGVEAESVPSMFIPFFTTKATAEKGTGLGLYVIKKIIENHGGEIEVNSTYGEGTTFTMYLPVAKEAA